MANAEITAHLRWHAGLGDQLNPRAPSLAECTWSGSPLRGRVSEGAEDFIAALSELNREINGPIPSESPPAGAEIPRDAAYAVAEVIGMLRDAAESASIPDDKHRMADAAWSIETAWRGLLAGDIDDLQQHLADERAARQ
jgi:hypothetical protein